MIRGKMKIGTPFFVTVMFSVRADATKDLYAIFYSDFIHLYNVVPISAILTCDFLHAIFLDIGSS